MFFFLLNRIYLGLAGLGLGLRVLWFRGIYASWKLLLHFVRQDLRPGVQGCVVLNGERRREYK